MRFVFIGALVLIILALSGYLYWITTPLYSLQSAGLAATRHDLEGFERYVNIEELVSNLLDDLIVKPSKTTPGLSGIQRETGNQIVSATKAALQMQLINMVRKAIGGGQNQQGRYTGHRTIYGADAAIAAPLAGSREVSDLYRAAGNELGRQAQKLKNETHMRLVACARRQPKTITGKLLGSPPQVIAFQAKLLVDEYGFTKDNFRGLTDIKYTKDSQGYNRAEVGLKFLSPKAGKEITVQLAMYQRNMFGDWCIFRVSNVPELMMALGEDYEYQIHSLMTCALSGVTDQSVRDEVNGLTRRIKEHPGAQELLNRLRDKFH